MKTISKSMLKPKMLEYFRWVEMSGEPLIVTSHNKPVLKIESIIEKKSLNELFGKFHGKVVLPEDIMKPESEEWGDI